MKHKITTTNCFASNNHIKRRWTWSVVGRIAFYVGATIAIPHNTHYRAVLARNLYWIWGVVFACFSLTGLSSGVEWYEPIYKFDWYAHIIRNLFLERVMLILKHTLCFREKKKNPESSSQSTSRVHNVSRYDVSHINFDYNRGTSWIHFHRPSDENDL